MKKIYNALFVACFLCILLYIPIATQLEPDEEYSVFENRNYLEVPEYSKEALLDGTYLQQWDKYLSDHIKGRDTILKACVNIDMKLLHKTVVNNVTVEQDALLAYNVPEHINIDAIDNSIKFMTDELSDLNQYIKQQGGEFYYVGVAEQYSALSDKYPSYIDNDKKRLSYIEKNFFNTLLEKDVKYIDMHAIMLAEGDIETKYSMLDHHYNIFGAFDTYQNIINSINESTKYKLKALKKEDIDFEPLDMPFLGSRNRKLYNCYPNDEKLYVANLKDPIEFTRMDNGEDAKADTFEIFEKDKGYVEYANYMGGDIAETIIDTNRPELPTILVFGDSFTNALETMLYYNFDKMFTLDLRHYTQETLYDYIDAVKPDVVICVRDNTCYTSTDGNGRFR
jgi:hypothetical protein